MSEPARKRTSNEPDTFREVGGFGKPEAKPGPSSERDPARCGQMRWSLLRDPGRRVFFRRSTPL